VEAIEIDVSDAGSVSRAADVVRTRLGCGGSEAARYLDAFINNAGVAPEDFSPSDFESCMEVNFRGVVRATDAFFPLIKPSNGRIVMTSSSSGSSFFAAAGLSDAEVTGGYGLSKALLNMYTMQLVRENPSLLVNACTLGLIKTDLG
ncbi:unnamed protein product, partial [Laminaria digitata]